MDEMGHRETDLLEDYTAILTGQVVEDGDDGEMVLMGDGDDEEEDEGWNEEGEDEVVDGMVAVPDGDGY